MGLIGAGSAKADLILSIGNSGLSGFPGPYGSVDVTLVDSKHATIDFTSNSAAGYYFVDGGSVAVNVDATSWTLGTVTGNSTSGSYSNGGSGNEDGFGSFKQTINSPNSGGTNRSTEITFSLTDISGIWSSAADVLTGNSQGYLAAAHIGVCTSSPCTGSGAHALATTGFAVNGATTPVPEPGSLALLGTMLIMLGGIGYVMRRRGEEDQL